MPVPIAKDIVGAGAIGEHFFEMDGVSIVDCPIDVASLRVDLPREKASVRVAKFRPYLGGRSLRQRLALSQLSSKHFRTFVMSPYSASIGGAGELNVSLGRPVHSDRLLFNSRSAPDRLLIRACSCS
jgi:hypothetical protein